MRLRTMQILLSIPCIIIDAITILAIGAPMFIITGKSIGEHDPLLMWLWELKNK